MPYSRIWKLDSSVFSVKLLKSGPEPIGGPLIRKAMSRKVAGKAVAKAKPAPPVRRGRPPIISETERRKRVLSAAEHVFVELGYVNASMDDIARQAGMSKKTLYLVFETKEALFTALVATRLSELADSVALDPMSDMRAPKLVLRDFLRGIVRFILAPRQAALYRLIVTEVHRAPELAQAFHQDCPGKLCSLLQEWIARQNARGILAVAEPEMASGMLVSMVIGEPQMQALMCGDMEEDPSIIEARIDYAVDLFLEGARPRHIDRANLDPRGGARRPVRAPKQ